MKQFIVVSIDLFISVVRKAFQLMYMHITIQRHSIFRVPTAGFNPPKQREDCYQSTTLPPSHHGFFIINYLTYSAIIVSCLVQVGLGLFGACKLRGKTVETELGHFRHFCRQQLTFVGKMSPRTFQLVRVLSLKMFKNESKLKKEKHIFLQGAPKLFGEMSRLLVNCGYCYAVQPTLLSNLVSQKIYFLRHLAF